MGLAVLGYMIPPASKQARIWLKDGHLEMTEPEFYYLPFKKEDLFLKEPSSGLAFQHRALLEDLPLPEL